MTLRYMCFNVHHVFDLAASGPDVRENQIVEGRIKESILYA
jgi:hypothetical protein